MGWAPVAMKSRYRKRRRFLGNLRFLAVGRADNHNIDRSVTTPGPWALFYR